MFHPKQNFKPVWWNQGNAAQPPHQCQPQQSTVGPQHSLSDPKPKPTTMNVAQRMGWPGVAPVPFLNPHPVTHLEGHSNEAPVIVDGQGMTALIDSGAHVSRISSQFCKDLALQIPPLGQLLELEGTRGSAIPYLGFVEVNLQILGIKNYNEDVLLLVIPTTTYSETVPVMFGSKIIDRVMSIIKRGACKSDHDMETGSVWSCHVWITVATLCKLRCNWGGKGGDPFLPKG